VFIEIILRKMIFILLEYNNGTTTRYIGVGLNVEK
jgi:hypothetical protein